MQHSSQNLVGIEERLQRGNEMVRSICGDMCSNVLFDLYQKNFICHLVL